MTCPGHTPEQSPDQKAVQTTPPPVGSGDTSQLLDAAQQQQAAERPQKSFSTLPPEYAKFAGVRSTTKLSSDGDSGVVWPESDESDDATDLWKRPASSSQPTHKKINSEGKETQNKFRDDPFIPLEQFVNLTGNGPS